MEEKQYKGLMLNLIHTNGSIGECKLLKSRSGIPDALLGDINDVLKQAFSKPPVQTTVAIGNLAEQEVFSYLQTIAQCSDIEVFDRSSEAGHGDLSVNYKEYNICLEVKRYQSALPRTQIDKYHRSLDLGEYHGGILLCMSSFGFAKQANIRTPIDVRIIGGKPSVYLSGIDLALLFPIIKMIGLIMDTKADSPNVSDLVERIEAAVAKVTALKDMIEKQKKLTKQMEGMLDEVLEALA